MLVVFRYLNEGWKDCHHIVKKSVIARGQACDKTECCSGKRKKALRIQVKLNRVSIDEYCNSAPASCYLLLGGKYSTLQLAFPEALHRICNANSARSDCKCLRDASLIGRLWVECTLKLDILQGYSFTSTSWCRHLSVALVSDIEVLQNDFERA